MRGAFGLVRPSGALRVNWAHPAARGLRHLFLCDGSGALDLVTGLRWAATNGGAGIGPWGIGWRSTGSGSQIIGPSGADAQFVGDQTTREITAVVGGRFSTSGQVSTALSNNTFASSGGWALKAEQYADTGNIGLTLPGVADYNSGIATPANDTVISAAILNGNTSFQAGFSSTSTVANAAPFGIGDNIVIGAQTRFSVYQDHLNSGDVVYWAAIIARALSQADQRVWHIAPFGTTIIRSSVFVVLANVGTASGAMTGTASLGFGAGATSLLGSGLLSGSVALQLSSTPTLGGVGTIAGSSALVFAGTNTLSGAGSMTAIGALAFANTGSAKGAGALAGSSAIVFAGTNALLGAGALSGASALTLSITGSVASGSIAGSSTITLTPMASLIGAGALAGSAGIAFTPTGSMGGQSPINGTASISLGAVGVLRGNALMTGQAAIQLIGSGVFMSNGALSGVAQMIFGGSVSIGDVTPPANRLVTVNGNQSVVMVGPYNVTFNA